MSNQEPPKIEFPCPNYPIKVMGEKGDQFRQDVIAVFEELAPGFDKTKVSERESSKATFVSMTVFIEAQSVEQLQSLHEALKALPATRMVM